MILQESSVLITGGAGDVGRFLVDGLRSKCKAVALLDLDDEKCEALKAKGVPFVEQCDLTDPEQIANSFDALEESGFVPDVIVNNAGLIYSEPLYNMLNREDGRHSLDGWQRTMAANVDTTFLVTREMVSRWMKKRKKGSVINISSISADGNPGQTAYSAAKGAVISMTKAWAKELGPMGLRFNAIAPGFFDTASTSKALNEAIIDRIKSSVPLRSLGDPADLLTAVAFLIENNYANGMVLRLDGGLTI